MPSVTWSLSLHPVTMARSSMHRVLSLPSPTALSSVHSYTAFLTCCPLLCSELYRFSYPLPCHLFTLTSLLLPIVLSSVHRFISLLLSTVLSSAHSAYHFSYFLSSIHSYTTSLTHCVLLCSQSSLHNIFYALPLPIFIRFYS
jgi:hypothetical protein